MVSNKLGEVAIPTVICFCVLLIFQSMQDNGPKQSLVCETEKLQTPYLQDRVRVKDNRVGIRPHTGGTILSKQTQSIYWIRIDKIGIKKLSTKNFCLEIDS